MDLPDQSLAARQALHRAYRRLTPEQQRDLYFRDPTTGALNERAFSMLPDDPTRPLVIFVEGEGGKWANEEPGSHVVGDRLLQAYAQALHQVDPEVAKVGGGFLLRARDEAHVDQLLEAARDHLPLALRGFELRAAAAPRGPSLHELLEQLGADLKAQKEHDETSTPPRRAPRGTRPFGSSVDSPTQLPLVDARVVAPVPHALVAAHDAMTYEQRFEAIHIEPGTRILTSDGFHRLPSAGLVVAFDLDGLAIRNELDGDAAGDAMLDVFGRILRQTGGAAFNAAHLHGDEYAAGKCHQDPEALRAWVATVQHVSDNVCLTFELGHQIVEWKGLGFQCGIGADYEEADRALAAAKAARKIELEAARTDKRGAELQRRSAYDARPAEGQASLDEARGRESLREGPGADGQREGRSSPRRREEARPTVVVSERAPPPALASASRETRRAEIVRQVEQKRLRERSNQARER